MFGLFAFLSLLSLYLSQWKPSFPWIRPIPWTARARLSPVAVRICVWKTCRSGVKVDEERESDEGRADVQNEVAGRGPWSTKTNRGSVSGFCLSPSLFFF